MRRPLGAIATVLVSLVLAGCGDGAQVETAPPVARQAPTQAAPRAEPLGRLVAVVGKRRDEAVRLLTSLGVQTEVESRAGCARGVVVAQEPGPRKVIRSEPVRLTVEDGGRPGECSLRPARRQARALVEWARDGGTAPAFAEGVELLIGNSTFERRLSTPLDRERWELCEHGEGCSSALTVLADMRRPALVRVPAGWCPDSYSLLPERLAETLGQSVTVVDRAAGRGCNGWAAVQLWVDDAGDISAVNWVL